MRYLTLLFALSSSVALAQDVDYLDTSPRYESDHRALQSHCHGRRSSSYSQPRSFYHSPASLGYGPAPVYWRAMNAHVSGSRRRVNARLSSGLDYYRQLRATKNAARLERYARYDD